MNPLVSVIVPAWNAACTLDRTLNSALAQTYRPLEIVVVDDGSTDDTGRIAASFAARHSEIKVVRQENRGVSAARNAGIAAAAGVFLALLDADDIWHPDKLARQMAIFETDPETALVYTYVRYIDQADRVVHDGQAQAFPPRALARNLYESLIGCSSAVMVRRTLVLELGGYEENWEYWEDLLLQLRVLAVHPIRCVPEYLVGYRLSPSSASRNAGRMLAAWRRASAQLRHEFPQVPARVHRWANASRILMYARNYAAQGQCDKATKLLAEALRDDPARVLRFLAERMLLSRNLHFDATQEFLSCNPKLSSLSTSAELPGFERRRAHQLEIMDRELTSQRGAA